MISYTNVMGHEQRLLNHLWTIYSIWQSDELWPISNPPHQDTYNVIASIYGTKRHFVVSCTLLAMILISYPNAMG